MEDELHDHCRSCYNRNCDFDIVEEVSCEIVFCHNDCGQKFHKCKLIEHDLICLNAHTPCLNKQYGCPVRLPRKRMSRHLDVCPANVVICMMEWNRLHRGSLLTQSDHTVPTKPMQGKAIISENMDVALAIHDQRVLLETIMPREILNYYSDLADGKSKIENAKSDLSTGENLNAKISEEKLQEDVSKSKTKETHNNFSENETKKKEVLVEENCIESQNEEKTELLDKGDERTEESCGSSKNESKSTRINGHKSISNELVLYMNKVRQARDTDTKLEKIASHFSGSTHDDSAENTSTHLDSPTTSTSSSSSILPYDGLFTDARRDSNESSESDLPTSSNETTKHRCVIKDFQHLDQYIKQFSSVSAEFLSLLDLLDSDACSAIDIVDFLVEEVTRKFEGQADDLPILNWDDLDIKSPSLEREIIGQQLCESINEMLQGLGEVCDQTLESISLPKPPQNSAEERKRIRKEERRKKRSWLYSSGVSGGPLTSWGWSPRKETKEATTDTDDLLVDRSNLEWLSPEANVSQSDLVSRLFSIIGAKFRGRNPHIHKQMTPYVVDSWCQTVAPFLVNIDMNAIGRALYSSSLTSSEQNAEERHRILSLMCLGHSGKTRDDVEEVKMSDNLAYNSLVLDSVMESLPRYQHKPPSMFSFMCGCELRRDQFSAHVANIHCEIMAGMNGWLEAKCPYAMYGCEYTQPRFHPCRQGDNLVYNQDKKSFAVRPSHDVSPDPHPYVSFLDLPYEVHERIFQFLDSLAMDQLSRTCSVMREMCEARLFRRGIVRMRWYRKVYEDGSKAWKLGKKSWSFPPHFTEIDRWVLSDCPTMTQHVARCQVASQVTPSYKERAKFRLTADTAELAELRRRKVSE